MLEGGLPLSEVALNCGFSDQAHFNKSFRKLIGTTAAAWRRSNREDSVVRHRILSDDMLNRSNEPDAHMGH
jgi:AraC-like DNA-binding protein